MITGRPRSSGSVTFRPSARRGRASGGATAPSRERRRPAASSSSDEACTGTAASRAATSAAASERIVAYGTTRPSVADPGRVDRLADVERRQEQLELGVLDGVGGEHVRAERRHAPLQALAHVPDLVLTRAPRGEVARQPL